MIDHDEEEAGAVHMRITQEPAAIHVAHDVLDAIEGTADASIIMHRQDDAGDDLDNQRDARQGRRNSRNS